MCAEPLPATVDETDAERREFLLARYHDQLWTCRREGRRRFLDGLSVGVLVGAVVVAIVLSVLR